jgi:hypothetical protein
MTTTKRSFTRQANIARSLNTQRKIAQHVIDATVFVEGISAPIVKCKAPKGWTRGNVTVKAGQEFFLVQSSRFLNRYYVVAWADERAAWQCSCYSSCKKHAHNGIANSYIVAHVVRPVQEMQRVAQSSTVAQVAQSEQEVILNVDSSVTLDNRKSTTDELLSVGDDDVWEGLDEEEKLAEWATDELGGYELWQQGLVA